MSSFQPRKEKCPAHAPGACSPYCEYYLYSAAPSSSEIKVEVNRDRDEATSMDLLDDELEAITDSHSGNRSPVILTPSRSSSSKGVEEVKHWKR